MILYAIKGNKPVTHIYPDVIAVPSDEATYHGAQKPVALYENLLQRSVKPGDTILDSFAGSGTIFPAAHRFKCSAVGVEQSAEYYGLCLKRLQLIRTESQLGLDLA
jgi:site-specific DNA-methyltransferase (adenine-specific)